MASLREWRSERSFGRLAVRASFVLLAIVALAAPTRAVTDPAAAWSFDEAGGSSVLDAVGSLHGTVSDATRIADGVAGGAIRFGGDGRVVVPDDPILSRRDISISLWVRADPQAPPADGAVIIQKGERDCQGGNYGLVVDGDYVAVRYRNPDNGQVERALMGHPSGLPSLWDGTWHHIGIVVHGVEYGVVSAYQQGWMAPSAMTPGVWTGGLDVDALGIGGSPDPACAAHGFRGDIDEVAVVDRTMMGGDFAADEPLISPTIEIERVDPLENGQNEQIGHAVVRMLPIPIRPGTFHVYLTPEGGTEREIRFERRVNDAWSLPDDGRFSIPLLPLVAGQATLRISYDADWGQIPTSASVPVTIARAATTTTGGGIILNVEGDPIPVTALVDAASVLVKATGTVELYEIVDGSSTYLASAEAELDPALGGVRAISRFLLPSRSAGTYTFQARYVGSGSAAPSESRPFEITVEPGVVPGDVSINGGAAVTDNPIVTVDTPATGAVAIQISRDLEDPFRTDPPIHYVPSKVTWLTAPWYGDDADGVRTIWVRWADVANRWTEWRSDSIILDRSAIQVGTISINGGAKVTANRDVAVAVPVADPAAVSAVELSNDGRTWQSVGYAPTLTWTLGGDGNQAIHARWRDLGGRASRSVMATIDVVPRAPTANVVRLSSHQVSTSIAVKWSATAASGAVANYDVRVRRAGWSGGFGPYALWRSATVATSGAYRGAMGSTYCFGVRARDDVGRTSAWTPDTCTAVPLDQGSLGRSAGWTRLKGARYYGGSALVSRRQGATLTRTGVTARRIAVLVTSCPTCGTLRVYWRGVLVRTVNLHLDRTLNRRLITIASFSSARTGTLALQVWSEGRSVIVDGVAILRR